MEIKSIDKIAKDRIKEYFNLPLGGKRVKCPYYISSKSERAGLRVMIGKGTPDEIAHEVKVWAKLKGVDLSKMTGLQIREFMIERNIGIDCSGFVAQVLNYWLNKTSGKSLVSMFEFADNSIMSRLRRFFRPIENIGANTMTSELNCIRVESYNDIKPYDLIRAKGKQKNAHHVALITDVYFDEKGNLTKFEYVHSHRFYEEKNGVRRGSVDIVDSKKPLKEQRWNDDYKGHNYMLEDLEIDYEDNGIRRLKFLS